MRHYAKIKADEILSLWIFAENSSEFFRARDCQNLASRRLRQN